jgi:hypothetical protein
MIGKIELVIGNQKQELDPDSELSISEETINDDLKNQPSLFAFYAVMQENMEADVAEKKLHLDALEAMLDEMYRTEAAKSGTKITETLLANKIHINQEYIDAASLLNKAKHEANVLRAIKEAFQHRKDMLITLASNMRAQFDPAICMNKEKYQKMGEK